MNCCAYRNSVPAVAKICELLRARTNLMSLLVLHFRCPKLRSPSQLRASYSINLAPNTSNNYPDIMVRLEISGLLPLPPCAVLPAGDRIYGSRFPSATHFNPYIGLILINGDILRDPKPPPTSCQPSFQSAASSAMLAPAPSHPSPLG
jgi:hypothetical protein